jgi:hypothetical protein
MSRKRLKPIKFNGLRKKCSSCGSIKEVQHRKVMLPQSNKAFNQKEQRKSTELPGAIVLHYCSIECAGTEFVNHWVEEDFYRI